MEETNKIPGPAIGYTELLDREIENVIKREAVEKNEKFFPLRPSSAGYCGRRLAYDLMAYRGYAKYDQDDFTPSTWKLLNLGHSVEYSVIKNMEHLKVHGIQVKLKQQVVTMFKLKDLPGQIGELIEGSCDGVLWSEKHKAIFDVKSMKDSFSAAFKTRFDDIIFKISKSKAVTQLSPNAFFVNDLFMFLEYLGPDDWHRDNFYQLSLYGYSNFMRARGVDHAVIWKYNKNCSREYELRFKPSKLIWDDVELKFNAINEAVHLKNPELIQRDYNLGSMKCFYCPHAKTCWKNDTKKAYFDTLPPKEWPVDLPLKSELSRAIIRHSLATYEASKAQATEQTVIKLMVHEGLMKVRLEDGTIWEIKQLKTPRPHMELRQGKL